MSDNNVVPFNASQLPADIAGLFDVGTDGDDLASGITGGFAVVSIRGSKWRIKHSGEETPVLDENDEPKASLEVVMLGASPNLSRIYYEKDFEEGDAEEPDCYSVDGIAPAADAKHKQCDTCAGCPQAVWGSKITPAGKKAKKCQDSKRIAVVPAGDIANEVYGGPMLLRVPAASLADLASYGKKMKAKGYSYKTIVTRLGFDMDASYPKLTFKAVRVLTEDEVRNVVPHLQGDQIQAILSTAPEVSAPPAEEKSEPAPAVDDEFEEPPAAAKPKPKKKAPAKKKAAAKKAAPADEPKDDSLDNALDDILSDLGSLD